MRLRPGKGKEAEEGEEAVSDIHVILTQEEGEVWGGGGERAS